MKYIVYIIWMLITLVLMITIFPIMIMDVIGIADEWLYMGDKILKSK